MNSESIQQSTDPAHVNEARADADFAEGRLVTAARAYEAYYRRGDLDTALGYRINGLIGHDLLRGTRLSLDFTRMQLRIV